MILFYTKNGTSVDLSDLKPDQVSIEEIANALSNQGRYNGQTTRYYSVAEHCVHLVKYAQRMGYSLNEQKALLLHDASEAFVGDIVYHLKQELPKFKELEDGIMSVIFDKYGVEYDSIKDVIHWLDRAICMDEMVQLMCRVDPILFSLKSLGIDINELGQTVHPEQAKHLYLLEAQRLELTNIG